MTFFMFVDSKQKFNVYLQSYGITHNFCAPKVIQQQVKSMVQRAKIYVTIGVHISLRMRILHNCNSRSRMSSCKTCGQSRGHTFSCVLSPMRGRALASRAKSCGKSGWHGTGSLCFKQVQHKIIRAGSKYQNLDTVGPKSTVGRCSCHASLSTSQRKKLIYIYITSSNYSYLCYRLKIII